MYIFHSLQIIAFLFICQCEWGRRKKKRKKEILVESLHVKVISLYRYMTIFMFLFSAYVLCRLPLLIQHNGSTEHSAITMPSVPTPPGENHPRQGSGERKAKNNNKNTLRGIVKFRSTFSYLMTSFNKLITSFNFLMPVRQDVSVCAFMRLSCGCAPGKRGGYFEFLNFLYISSLYIYIYFFIYEYIFIYL